MITIPLLQAEFWPPAPPEPARRLFGRAVRQPPTRLAFEEVTIDVSAAHVAPLLLLGKAGAGKSVALDLWAWRLLRAGARVVLIGGAHNQHESLVAPAQAAGYATAIYHDSADLDSRHDAAGLTVIRDDHIPPPQCYALVGAALKAIGERRQVSAQGLLVIVDGEVPPDSIAPQLAEVLATWPALNLHFWFVAQSARDLTEATTFPARSLWAAARVRCHGRTDRSELPHAGLSPNAAKRAAWQSRSDLVYWEPRGERVGHVQAADGTEVAIIARREERAT